ncbi:MAG: ABC transporter ATP-binding protein [Anaerolineaceae bacterium]|nr:ABC transporter ATP-binding protein [Anaerolineaceae bacterium]
MQTDREHSLLSVESLQRVFVTREGFTTTRLEAVAGASFAIRNDQPEIYTLAGESGSGKTTLARLVLGLEHATSGNMYYKGRDVLHLTNKERRDWFLKEVQPIFQDPFATFSPLKRIDSYLYETTRNYKMATTREGIDAHVDEALHAVGLSLAEIRGRYPNELSGGQAQRVSVARALLTRPSLLVADEPVSMLDASLRMSIVNLFRSLRDDYKVSVLYITHDLTTAYYAADRIAIMLRGWVVESGPVEKVLGEPLHPYTQNLKNAIPEADPEKTWEGDASLAVMDTEEYTRTGCRYAGRCPAVMDICKTTVPRDIEVQGRSVKCFLYDEEVPEAERMQAMANGGLVA